MMPGRHRAHRWFSGAALLVAGLFLTAVVHGDDLAALARKERARRARIAKPAKVITEDTIEEIAAKGGGSLTTLAPDSSSGEPTPAAETPVTDPEAQKADWKQRADAARAALAAAQQKLEDLEQARASFQSDQAPLSAAEAQDPMRLQKREVKIAEMTAAIELQKQLVIQARQAIEALEDAARKSGVPPGWLR